MCGHVGDWDEFTPQEDDEFEEQFGLLEKLQKNCTRTTNTTHTSTMLALSTNGSRGSGVSEPRSRDENHANVKRAFGQFRWDGAGSVCCHGPFIVQSNSALWISTLCTAVYVILQLDVHWCLRRNPVQVWDKVADHRKRVQFKSFPCASEMLDTTPSNDNGVLSTLRDMPSSTFGVCVCLYSREWASFAVDLDAGASKAVGGHVMVQHVIDTLTRRKVVRSRVAL